MWLKQIKFEGIRNLEAAELSFDRTANYFIGDNGAGKTSLLEAIHLLAVGRSFRTNQDQEILKISAPYWKITGIASDEEQSADLSKTETVISAEIRFVNNTKTTFLQGIKQDKLSSYLGWLPVVTMLLTDIELISGPPQIRRNFVDLAISKINKNYLKNLINYRHILIQRNKLLQENAEDDLYEAWEADLAKYGSLIFQD
ncbi:MAG: AAA family ATPase, partial [candidate division WOR-3 bacterium]|nr:AAA family ATPase [candidate division WOR-3 bacterium]